MRARQYCAAVTLQEWVCEWVLCRREAVLCTHLDLLGLQVAVVEHGFAPVELATWQRLNK